MCHDPGQHLLDLVHIISEISVSHPGDTINSDYGNHSRPPDRTRGGFLQIHLAEDDHQGSGAEHNDLDSYIHLREFGQSFLAHHHLAESQGDNHKNGAKENVNSQFRLLIDNLVKGGGITSVDIITDSGILYPLLELRILIQIFSSAERSQGGEEKTYHAGRDGHHKHLRDRHIIAVRVGNSHESDHRGGNRRTSDSHLGCDRGHTTRSFGTDSLLDGDVHDNRHKGIYNMTGTHENSQEEGCEGGQDCDTIRMLPEHLLRKLDKPIHATGSLQDSSACDRGDDYVNDVGGRRTGLHSEAEYQDRQTNSGNGAKREAAVSRSHVEGGENYQQLNDH